MDSESQARKVRFAEASRLADTVRESCALPAVATHGWCERASLVAGCVRPSAVVSVTIARLSVSGEVTDVEDTGVSGEGLSAGDYRAFATRFTRGVFSWPRLAQGERGSDAHVCRADLSAHTADAEASCARFWSARGVRELVIGCAPLAPKRPRRVLVVEAGRRARARNESVWGDAAFAAVVTAVARRAERAFGEKPKDRAPRISVREQRVLDELLRGFTVRAAAERLGRSEHTVQDYVKSMHRKIGARHRGELLARVMGVIDDKELQKRREVDERGGVAGGR